MSGEEILAIYRGGDRERAFRELVNEYSERLYWHIRDLVGSHDDTDDLLQNVFVKIWAALPSFRGDAQLFTWIYRIATNEAISFLKKQKLRSFFKREDGTGDEAEKILADDPAFSGDETQRLLSVAISQLPPKQKAIFCMRYYDEIKYSEIAEILGGTEGSVKASYHFAYEKVKDFMLKHLPE